MIDFPPDPAVGDTVTGPDGTTWTWNGSTWDLTGGGSGGGGGGSGGGGDPTPAGVISDFIGTIAPTGYLGMEGQTVVSGQTIHPELWKVLPATMKVGADIVFPDTRGRMFVGLNAADPLFATPGAVGGSKDAVVVSHSHNMAHTHNTEYYGLNGMGDYSFDYGPTFRNSFISPNVGPSTAADTAPAGVAGTNANLPPFIAFMKIVKV